MCWYQEIIITVEFVLGNERQPKQKSDLREEKSYFQIKLLINLNNVEIKVLNFILC